MWKAWEQLRLIVDVNYIISFASSVSASWLAIYDDVQT